MRWDNLFEELSSSFRAKENLQNAQANYFQHTYDLLGLSLQSRLKALLKQYQHQTKLTIQTHSCKISHVQLMEVGDGWISVADYASPQQKYNFYIIPLPGIEHITIQTPSTSTHANKTNSTKQETNTQGPVTSIKIMLKITHILSDLRRKMTTCKIYTPTHNMEGKIKNVYQDHVDLVLILHSEESHKMHQNSTVTIPIRSIHFIKTHMHIYE